MFICVCVLVLGEVNATVCVICICMYCACVCMPQQLRMGLFLSGLNGNTELSESAFPL